MPPASGSSASTSRRASSAKRLDAAESAPLRKELAEVLRACFIDSRDHCDQAKLRENLRAAAGKHLPASRLGAFEKALDGGLRARTGEEGNEKPERCCS